MKLTEAPKFRDLAADEIEVRVAKIYPSGVRLLLYKDARCDMNLLDETVGAENWQRRHYEEKGNLFCSVGININNEWIWKDDVGAESNRDKEKGEASDSFKRACFNWGIGRELYTSPFIWVKRESLRIETTPKGKEEVKDRLVVKEIKTKDKKITELLITSNKGNLVFSYKKESPENKIEKCESCGLFITGFTDKEGKEWTAKEAEKFSVDTFGKKLCQKCMKIHNDSIKIAKSKDK